MHLMLDNQFSAMPWAEIDAVVFDVGNVLLSWKEADILNAVLPDRPDLHDELTTRVFRTPYWVMGDRGTITPEEAIAAMSRTAPELAPYIRRVMEGWIDLPELPEGIEVLKACKAHGKKVYVLSNYPSAAFEHARQTHSFFVLFDGIVVSSHEHIIKPSLNLFALVADRFDLTPSRTLFIDDSPANVEAALESGWQSICYNRPGRLARFFAD